MKPKEILIQEIIQKEEAMFRTVRPSEPSACQKRVKTFRRMRIMSHWVLPEQVLESILQDLTREEAAGRNLVAERYTYLFREFGYNSVDDMEKKQRAQPGN